MLGIEIKNKTTRKTTEIKLFKNIFKLWKCITLKSIFYINIIFVMFDFPFQNGRL